MKVNVTSTKLIKPCTPTPQNLNKYKISLTDELSPPMNVSVILFYPPNPNPNPNSTIISQLQESLSKILPQFYPFAGRYIKKDHSVHCNDEGAEFVVAEATDIELVDFIAKVKSHDQLKDLLSRQTGDVDKSTDPLLSVQITNFKCGGLAISVTMSHRVSDASSLETFITAWSDANIINNQEPIIPSFESPSLFPGINLDYDVEPTNDIIVVKRLLFNKEAISSLKSKLRPRNGKGFLSRVRVVSAVIAKALIGVDMAKHGKLRDCFILQAVNMRGRTSPPLPKHACGNLLVESITQYIDTNNTKEVEMQELVNISGDAIDKTVNDCAELLSVDEDRRIKIIMDPITNFVTSLVSGEVNAVWFSDWSKFGFYEADFGWGNKPVWVGIGNLFCPNFTLLMGNKEGDGIEAWVYLNQNDVPYFEQDEDMKLFTIS
ncbi:pelargonidin 3-o-(6-caffeoylglucoside) 5-o-(6-o-malonylglucoside) 4'''-malonyltransferase [Phtheirospermum japonicum]|uniref:Pelargonidin 3-o-(6-caffeoylglucoside) 5-o-(6-o-malonylglucoside) 4'''-malonyltransferase n=1 Tax=Phtheirospermum japonicum TaxID=374723 RepID=A0A830DKV8_9LAMI|nr:pelargonidin 3-o-(6-caffeoylglucoside) 5-o-(6-o-malonylglucoside) 4'''-malonyltransferase [Phtheirospermum japonicum]GFQ08505.1 pelargonidin 3-o-(6-caffeoylglucoside) 5-o-(6-o-malonylglucoside) 4'''-malonyltransferase [Phtheirospermum japonicum]